MNTSLNPIVEQMDTLNQEFMTECEIIWKKRETLCNAIWKQILEHTIQVREYEMDEFYAKIDQIRKSYYEKIEPLKKII